MIRSLILSVLGLILSSSIDILTQAWSDYLVSSRGVSFTLFDVKVAVNDGFKFLVWWCHSSMLEWQLVV